MIIALNRMNLLSNWLGLVSGRRKLVLALQNLASVCIGTTVNNKTVSELNHIPEYNINR